MVLADTGGPCPPGSCVYVLGVDVDVRLLLGPTVWGALRLPAIVAAECKAARDAVCELLCFMTRYWGIITDPGFPHLASRGFLTRENAFTIKNCRRTSSPCPHSDKLEWSDRHLSPLLLNPSWVPSLV